MNSIQKSSKNPLSAPSRPLPIERDDESFSRLRGLIDSEMEEHLRPGWSDIYGWKEQWSDTWDSQAGEFAPKATPEDWLRLAFWAVKAGRASLLAAMAACEVLEGVLAGLDEAQVTKEERLLSLAAERPKVEAIAALVALGCDPKGLNADGDTALKTLSDALGHRREDALECAVILAPISDVDAVNEKGETALMAATQAHSAALVKLLAPLSNTSLQDQEGRTALHMAAVRNKKITALLATCTDLRLADKDGKTALDRAVDGAAWECADVLMARLPAREATAMLRKINEKLFPSTVPHVEAAALEDALGLGVEASGEEPAAKGRADRSKPKKAPKTRRM